MKKYMLNAVKSMGTGLFIVLGMMLGFGGVYAALNWDALVESNTPLTASHWNSVIDKIKGIDSRLVAIESRFDTSNCFKIQGNTLESYSDRNIDCTTTAVRIPDSVTIIGENAFASNSLQSVDLNNVTTIGENAFSGNQLTSVTIPNSVTTIGGYAFSNNQLTSIVFPDNVTSIGYGAFEDNLIENVDLNNVTTIGAAAFSGNPLTNITIRKSNLQVNASSNYVNSISPAFFNYRYSTTSTSNPIVNINFPNGYDSRLQDGYYTFLNANITIGDISTTYCKSLNDKSSVNISGGTMDVDC